MPAVSVIVATHERSDELRVTLASIAVQTFEDFECLVVHEPGDWEPAFSIVTSFDDRFTFLHAPTRWNDWGNSAKDWATRHHAAGEIVGHANGDNWYAPIYLDRMAAPILNGEADFTYCDFITHNTQYDDVYRTKPEPAWIDGGGWLCRKEIVVATQWDHEGSSPDGHYAQALANKGRPLKVPGVLWAHC